MPMHASGKVDAAVRLTVIHHRAERGLTLLDLCEKVPQRTYSKPDLHGTLEVASGGVSKLEALSRQPLAGHLLRPALLCVNGDG
jgi:hypothetical protein